MFKHKMHAVGASINFDQHIKFNVSHCFINTVSSKTTKAFHNKSPRPSKVMQGNSASLSINNVFRSKSSLSSHNSMTIIIKGDFS